VDDKDGHTDPDPALAAAGARRDRHMSRAADAPPFDSQTPWGTYAPGAWHGLLLRTGHSLGPGLRRLVPALRRPIKYGVHHAVDVTIWGLRLRLLPRGNMAETKLLFAPQLFDREELELLERELQPGATFVDIGANVGAYTYWAHRCLQGRGRIVAVEPDPEMRRRLEFNLHTNGVNEVDVCPVALSDAPGFGELLVNPAQRGQNTLVQGQAQSAGGQRIVQRVELDTLVHVLQSRGIEKIDALKIDIEGHEPPVLRHFFEHAPQSLWPRLAIIEYMPETVGTIESLFAVHGYRRGPQTRLNLTFVR
jgi:FkbM family methyltransferase